MYRLKGQSAIEYLMTYGWMLLVVAVAGGAVFSVVGDQNVESVNGFTGDDVQVDDFGLSSDGGLDIVLRNSGSESVTVNSVKVTDDSYVSEWSGAEEISVSDTESVALANVSESSGNNELGVEVNYDAGGLTDLSVSGTLTGGFELTGDGSTGSTPEPMSAEDDDFEVTQE